MASMSTASEHAPAIQLDAVSHTYPAVRSRPARRNGRDAACPAGSAFATRPALDSVTFTINRGEMFAILGPNGGGKTTLFRIITTMLRQSAGVVRVCGHDVAAEPARVRALLGVVFQSPGLDTQLTAAENLRCHGQLYGLAGHQLEQRINHWLERFGLDERRHDRIESFSGGMRRRIELAKAMLHQPPVLLLDEPATGLDPGGRRELWRCLDQLRTHGVTIALTTHLMEAADRCDRIAILNEGKLVAAGAPAELKTRIGGDVFTLEPADEPERLCLLIADRFAPWPDGGEPSIVDGRIHFERREGPPFITTLHEAFPGRIRSATIAQPTLEDVFLHLTGQTLWENTNDQ